MADFFGMTESYITDFLRYTRRRTNEVNIGGIPLGSMHPIRLQTMTNTATSDVQSTVKQIISMVKAGAEYARMTVTGRRDADALGDIVAELSKRDILIPLIADIHFNPALALISAETMDKVRINPGNFVDRKQFITQDYNDEKYAGELNRLQEKFLELLEKCRKHRTTLRIGTNHGSLSDRIMTRFGDSPQGMAESAMEFLRICKAQNFDQVVVSMKSSNTRIMVYATRLLISMMMAEDMHYPLHLGVTEAGEGEDGRIKSAVGIGALLADGIGDTIRVSLTEDPELEIPVARKIVSYVNGFHPHAEIKAFGKYPLNPYDYQRRKSAGVQNTGGDQMPVVIHRIQGNLIVETLTSLGWIEDKNGNWTFGDLSPDYLWLDSLPSGINLPLKRILVDSANYLQLPGVLPVCDDISEINKIASSVDTLFLRIKACQADDILFEELKGYKNVILMLESENRNIPADLRAAIFRLMNSGDQHPIILMSAYNENAAEDFQLKASVDLGGLFIDGLGDGICLHNEGALNDVIKNNVAFGILQAARVRISKTEFISCPSCGRTLFDLQSTTKKIRERTSHLKGLKIGIMGCIVNGPGEMADADYGYVGTGTGRVTLYRQKHIVKRNIPEDQAVEELLNLIRENGDWIDIQPPV
jgi:(E)-4-hydroxy-3-methylbut-2-enyl-diphosphate synthase